MPLADPTHVLRPGLLEGVSLVLASAPEGAGLAPAVEQVCAALGARVAKCALPLGGEVEGREAATERAVEAARSELPDVDALVLDAAALFARASGSEALMGCLQACWDASRAIANHAFIPGERGGRVILVAPAPDAGEHADAARAGLENLARTLSIEWSRYAVTAVAIAPGPDTSDRDVAGIVAFLCSPAGAYFSGCLLDLRGPGVAAPSRGA